MKLNDIVRVKQAFIDTTWPYMQGQYGTIIRIDSYPMGSGNMLIIHWSSAGINERWHSDYIVVTDEPPAVGMDDLSLLPI